MSKQQCFSCGREEWPLISVGAFLDDEFKLCHRCYVKFQNKSGVKEEADRLMVEVEFEPEYTCMNCGAPVLARPDGQVPVYCRDCTFNIHKVFKGFVQ